MSGYRPIIGIPCRSDTSGLYTGRQVNAQNITYTNAILHSGGIPILIPVEVTGESLRVLFEQVDGILFCGGGDVDPAYYHQTPQVENLSDIQKGRDEHELNLFRMATREQKPFFAICRGIQVMNVAGGGDLWQDLASQNPDTIRHDYYYSDDHLPRDYIAHEVILDQSSLLYKIVQSDRLAVNSLHHQAIREVAPIYQAAGRAIDGVVEVLELPDHPFGLGVQWHPEELFRQRRESRQMFAAFVDACRNGHKNGA